MAGKGIPHRYINRRTNSLRDRNVNEVCLYFKELRIHSAIQPTLNPIISVKALPESAKANGSGESREVNGAEKNDDTPDIKLSWDPKAKRKPGQVLKLYTSYNELTSKDGAKFGWVDPTVAKTTEERDAAYRRSIDEFKNRPPVYVNRYGRDKDGQLTGELVEKIRIKELGRSIGSQMGRVSTQAFQAAGGVIDANGKLRCPPGTPNANQFTDLDMTNCMTIGVGTIVRSIARIGSRLNQLAERGSDIQNYGRVLSPRERERQKRFEATRASSILGRDATAEAAAAFDAAVDAVLQEHGVTADASSASANSDLIAGLSGVFRKQFGEGREKEADEALRRFLFGTSTAERDANNKGGQVFAGGIFADASTPGDEFEWKQLSSDGELFSPENIALNTAEYDKKIRTQIAKYLGIEDLQDTPEGQKAIQAIRDRHHVMQREFIKTHIAMRQKYPEAAERVGELRAIQPGDLRPDEPFTKVEGSCIAGVDEFGDLKAVVSHNALGMALDSFADEGLTGRNLSDGTYFIDVPDGASEAERRATILSTLEQLTNGMLYAEVSGYANETSAARLEAAVGLDAAAGRARHVALHEFGHVLQLNAAQQKIIDTYKQNGSFSFYTEDGVIEFREPPSTWTNEQWLAAIFQTNFQGDRTLNFPPDGAIRFEGGLVNLFAGRRYKDDLARAEQLLREGRADEVPDALRAALLEGTTEVFAQREMGIIGGPDVDDAIAWMLPENNTYHKVRDIPWRTPDGYGEDIEPPPTPDSPPTPDIPTNPDPPRGGTGTVNINNGTIINGDVNITINIIYGPTPDETGTPSAESTPKPTQVDIGWTDIAGHIFMDDETQWQPGKQAIPVDQNPDEVRRFVDAAFGLGPEHGGPDPSDPLSHVRQKDDAYWKMTPQQLDARFEKLDTERKRLIEKSKTEPLTADEQAKLWLSIKGMRQILDVNTKKSKLSDEDVAKYEARGWDPEPGKYMRFTGTQLRTNQKGLRKSAIDRRTDRGYEPAVEFDDDELAHWQREIANHAGDAASGRDGFDASSRGYEPGKIRHTQGPTSKEKRKLNPNYKPTQQEVEAATLSTDPALVGRRKIDEVAERRTPEQIAVIESPEPVEASEAWTGMSDAIGGDSEQISNTISRSARARSRLGDGAGTMSRPDEESTNDLVENQLRDTIVPTLDVLDDSVTDDDISMVASIEVDETIERGMEIDHDGPIRGLLIDSNSADALKYSSPKRSQRAVVVVPKGSKATHAKNGHDGDTDGLLIPPGTLEVMDVKDDGTVVLMPKRQKTKRESLQDMLDAVEGLDVVSGSPEDAEKRALRKALRTELANTPPVTRSIRGASGDGSVRALQEMRSSSAGDEFTKRGSSFFGTHTTNGSMEFAPIDGSGYFALRKREEEARKLRDSLSANMSNIKDVFTRLANGEPESEDDLDLIDGLSEQVRSLIELSTPEQLLTTIQESIFKYHEKYDDRPRIAISPEQFENFLNNGHLPNAVESNPSGVFSRVQKAFELDNGLGNDVPDGMRSHFGYMVHATQKQEIQDYLDELPTDGFVRDVRFFSSSPDMDQFKENHSGGKSVELILVPETSKRTAYTRGDVLDNSKRPVPVLSSNRDEVAAAHLSGPNSTKSNKEQLVEQVSILDNSASGTFTAFGTSGTSTRSSRSRTSTSADNAVIGGGVRWSDIEGLAIDTADLQLGDYVIDADAVGGREKLLRLLKNTGVTGNLDDVLDKLLRGDTDIPKSAEHLAVAFSRMRLVLGARAMKARWDSEGRTPELIFKNPDGFDLLDTASFTNLPEIPQDASEADKLFGRLRHDSFGAKMRRIQPTGRRVDRQTGEIFPDERERYYATGRLRLPSGEEVALPPVTERTGTGGTTGLGGMQDPETGRIIPRGGESPTGGWKVPGMSPDDFTPRRRERPRRRRGESGWNNRQNINEYIRQTIDENREPTGLSRVGKGGKTQIDTRRSKLIANLTWDDDNRELVVTWKDGRTETYSNVDERAVLLLEETYDDESVLISDVVGYIRDNSTVTQGGEHGPDFDPESGINIERRERRLRSSRGSRFSEVTDDELLDEWNNSRGPQGTPGQIGLYVEPPKQQEARRERRVELLQEMRNRGMKDPDDSAAESLSLAMRQTVTTDEPGRNIRTPRRSDSRPAVSRSTRSVTGTSGNTSSTPAAKRGVRDTFDEAVGLGPINDDGTGGLHDLNDDELSSKFPGVSRSDNMAMVDGQRVFVVDDIDTAAALIAAGYHVELSENAPSPALLVEASANLQAEIDEYLDATNRPREFVIDTCRLYVAGSNLWCEGGLGTKRIDMPQIAGRMRGDDSDAAKAAKTGAVKVSWKGGRRDADGNLTDLTPAEKARFDELKGKHAKLNKDGTVTPHSFEEGEMEEFYSMVDWNDTEVDLTNEFKDYAKRLSAIANPDKNPDEVIYDADGIDPDDLAVSQGQIQMSKTGGMVTSMRHHDHSFAEYMKREYPDIKEGSDEFYDMRDRWLYGQGRPDGKAFEVPLIDLDGNPLNSDGKPIGEGGTQGIIGQPWFTSGSIISTSDGYVVDGHHRWASFIAYNHGKDERAKLKLRSTVIDAPIQDALAIGKAFQEHWGIKEAKLGQENFFKKVDNPETMDIDGKAAHLEKLFEVDESGTPLAQRRSREIYKELYEQKEGFGFVERVASSTDSGADAEGSAPAITSGAGVSRSSRSIRNPLGEAPVIGGKRPSKPRRMSSEKAKKKYITEMAAYIIEERMVRPEAKRRGLVRLSGMENMDKLTAELEEVYATLSPKSAAEMMGVLVELDLAGTSGDVAKGRAAQRRLERVANSIKYPDLRIGTEVVDGYSKSDEYKENYNRFRELSLRHSDYLEEQGMRTYHELNEDSYKRSPQFRKDAASWGEKNPPKDVSISPRRSFRDVTGGSSRSARIAKQSEQAATSPQAEAIPKTQAQKRFDEIQRIEQAKSGALHEMNNEELKNLGISRVDGRTGITDGKPVYRADTPESAVAMMALGYNVELGDGAKAKQLKKGIKDFQEQIDEYLKLRTDLSEEEKAMYKIDACRMYVPNTNIFCGKNIGTKRRRMPQISGRLKGDDTVGARAAKAGLVKTSWEPRKDLTPEELAEFDKLKKRHKNPQGKYPNGEGPLTEAERSRFYELVNWKETEVDFVPLFMDHLRRKAGRDDIVVTKNGVRPDDYTASQSEIQADKVSGMLLGIDEAYTNFINWAEKQGAKRGTPEFMKLRQEWLDGKYDGKIPVLDADGNQVIDKGKPKWAEAWWVKGAIITSNDGYVVDGHHRWAAVHIFNQDLPPEEQLTINTQEIDVGIFDALNLAKSYQEEIGIKEAKLGLEDDYVKDSSVPEMSEDDFAAFIQATDDNLESNFQRVRDSRAYVPDGAYRRVNQPTTGTTRGFVAAERPQTIRDVFNAARSDVARTRSSRSARNFSDDYPAMAKIGLDPRPNSGVDADDAFYDRQLAERILSGASVEQRKEFEKIASDAVESVRQRQADLRQRIVASIGSEEALDDLLVFDRPTPRAWSDMSAEQKRSIEQMLDEMREIEHNTFNETIEKLVEMSDKRREIRNANITAARRVSRSARTPSGAQQGRRYVSEAAVGIAKQIDTDKVANSMASAFKRSGMSGVLKELRKTLRNDSSGWAIDYAVAEGYITKAQAKFLKTLAKRLFSSKPKSRPRKKSLDANVNLQFGDLINPPLYGSGDKQWL